MANITSPPIAWGSPSLMPQSQSFTITVGADGDIAPPSVVVYSGGILTSPRPNQLVNEAATGTPF